jgi:hypothetical protein
LEEVERGELKPAAAPLDWLFEFKLSPPHAFVQVVAERPEADRRTEGPPRESVRRRPNVCLAGGDVFAVHQHVVARA